VDDLATLVAPVRTRGRATRAAWNVLAVAVVAQVGYSVLEQGIPLLTGFIKDDLRISAFAAGLAVSSFMFGKIFGSYAAGVAADRLGERRVLVAGGVATAVLVVVSMLAPVPFVFVLLVVAGLASASATPAGGRLVLLAFPPNRRGLALGIRQTAIPVGGLIAAAALPWIAHARGWRWAFVAAGIGTAVAVIPLALSRVGDAPARPAGRVVATPSPARDRNLRLLTTWGCLLVTGQFATLAFMALDFHRRAHLSLASASLLVGVAQAVGIAGRIGWGAASDRILSHGRKPLLLVLTGTALLSALVLLATPRSAPVGVLVAASALAGLALIGYQGLWVTMIAEAAGPHRVGAATGFAVTFVVASVAVTPPLYGLVADVFGTYRAVWGALSIVLALAFIPALLVEERAR
jgi:MFS family permease